MEAIMSRNKIEAKGSAFSVSPEKDNTVSRDGIARQTNLRFGHCARDKCYRCNLKLQLPSIAIVSNLDITLDTTIGSTSRAGNVRRKSRNHGITSE